MLSEETFALDRTFPDVQIRMHMYTCRMLFSPGINVFECCEIQRSVWRKVTFLELVQVKLR
jgi:hypothetical protein